MNKETKTLVRTAMKMLGLTYGNAFVMARFIQGKKVSPALLDGLNKNIGHPTNK